MVQWTLISVTCVDPGMGPSHGYPGYGVLECLLKSSFLSLKDRERKWLYLSAYGDAQAAFVAPNSMISELSTVVNLFCYISSDSNTPVANNQTFIIL